MPSSYDSSSNLATPIGSVIALTSTSIPANYLLCDGAAVSKTTYAALFAVIGTAYGEPLIAGSNFNVPDFRGRFLRGLDGGAGRDPDAAGRTAMNPNGATGNNLGTVQAQATRKNALALTDPGHVHSHRVPFSFGGAADGGGATTNLWSDQGGSPPHFGDVASASTGITLGNGDNETRPINANIVYAIRYR